MSWLTNFVRPKIRALVGAVREIPDDLWDKCPSCGVMLFRRELEANLSVCHHCDHHFRLDPLQRLAHLFDGGRYAPVVTPAVLQDPLRFRDRKKYTDRLKEARAQTGRMDALVVGEGDLGSAAAIVAAFDFQFLGGSMGLAVGAGMLAAAERAVARQAPLIVVPASGGARMQEGILSLMQLPRTILAVQQVRAAGLPYIVILSDPTTGGVTASFAMVGDVHIAERGALIGFAGARVIQSTIRETLPEGFQRAEYLREHGMVDVVVHRKDLRETLIRILAVLRHGGATQRAKTQAHGRAGAQTALAFHEAVPHGMGAIGMDVV